ncbi:MAG: hypothetical protein J5I47_10810 [Vicingus serpentipes]|nr:hypothetical protein [Vicingus serpentipes]
MKDINNIEDWYRNEMESYHVTPDKEVWNSLSEDLDASAPLTDENVSEWYKKEVAKFAERPDYTVWEKLSTNLDTASVWDKLVVSLNAYDKYIWWRNLVFKGTAIVVLLLGSYLAFRQAEPEQPIVENKTKQLMTNEGVSTSQVVKNVHQQEKTSNSTNADELLLKKEHREISSTMHSKNYGVTNNNRGINDGDLLASKGDIQKITTLYAPELNESTFNKTRDIERNIQQNLLSEKNIVLPAEQKEFLVKKEKNKIVFNNKRFSSYFVFGLYARRFYTGLNFAVKKQGIISTIKNTPEFEKYTQKYFLDFGSSVGGTFGWIVSDKLNLEANVNINSTAGYQRAFSNEAVSFKEELNLNYITLSVLAKRMNNKSTFDNKKYSTNLIGGFYAGQLRSATSNVNGVSSNNDCYKNTDLGLVIGIEQDRYLTKALLVTPGIRYQQGLMNVSNSSSMFSSSRNFSLEFNLGIKYIFLKKG